MKKIILSILLLCAYGFSSAQSKAGDIPVAQLPAEVKQILDEYINILSTSKTAAECEQRLTAIAGGGLVNEDGNSLRSTVPPYSMKKDYDNCKFYSNPVVVTRVNKSNSNGSGFGASAIKGTVYKIWIGKKDPKNGLPAPISIMVPNGHATIKTPKVIGIGSL
jgi:hypothetical protein